MYRVSQKKLLLVLSLIFKTDCVKQIIQTPAKINLLSPLLHNRKVVKLTTASDINTERKQCDRDKQKSVATKTHSINDPILEIYSPDFLIYFNHLDPDHKPRHAKSEPPKQGAVSPPSNMRLTRQNRSITYSDQPTLLIVLACSDIFHRPAQG